MSFDRRKHLQETLETAEKNGTELKLVLPVTFVGSAECGVPKYVLPDNTRKKEKEKKSWNQAK